METQTTKTPTFPDKKYILVEFHPEKSSFSVEINKMGTALLCEVTNYLLNKHVFPEAAMQDLELSDLIEKHNKQEAKNEVSESH